MSNHLVDFSFVYEMSDNDTAYVHEVTSLFLKTVSDGLDKLQSMIETEDDTEVIRKQAHFLKSSANIIRVKGMFDKLMEMESLARDGAGKNKMIPIINDLYTAFKNAKPELEAEIRKTKPQDK